MDIKNRAYRFGDKIAPVRSGKNAVEDNFGTKAQWPLSPLTRLLWILGVLVVILGGVLCYMISRPKPPNPTRVEPPASAMTADAGDLQRLGRAVRARGWVIRTMRFSRAADRKGVDVPLI